MRKRALSGFVFQALVIVAALYFLVPAPARALTMSAGESIIIEYDFSSFSPPDPPYEGAGHLFPSNPWVK